MTASELWSFPKLGVPRGQLGTSVMPPAAGKAPEVRAWPCGIVPWPQSHLRTKAVDHPHPSYPYPLQEQVTVAVPPRSGRVGWGGVGDQMEYSRGTLHILLRRPRAPRTWKLKRRGEAQHINLLNLSFLT